MSALLVLSSNLIATLQAPVFTGLIAARLQASGFLSFGLFQDLILMIISGLACLYCVILNRRVQALSNMKTGLGASIVSLTDAIRQTQSAAKDTEVTTLKALHTLQNLMDDAESTISRLEAKKIDLDRQVTRAAKLSGLQSQLVGQIETELPNAILQAEAILAKMDASIDAVKTLDANSPYALLRGAEAEPLFGDRPFDIEESPASQIDIADPLDTPIYSGQAPQTDMQHQALKNKNDAHKKEERKKGEPPKESPHKGVDYKAPSHDDFNAVNPEWDQAEAEIERARRGLSTKPTDRSPRNAGSDKVTSRKATSTKPLKAATRKKPSPKTTSKTTTKSKTASKAKKVTPLKQSKSRDIVNLASSETGETSNTGKNAGQKIA